MKARKFWFIFSGIQIIGLVASSYGSAAAYGVGPHSESVFFRFLGVLGGLLLSPGNLIARVLATGPVGLPCTVAFNAAVWLYCAWLTRAVREHVSDIHQHRQGIVLCATVLMFIVINIVHSMRSAFCADCSLPHGIPFTLYHEGGFAGGEAIVWSGLVADIAVVLAVGWMLARLWGWLAEKRTAQQSPNS